MERQLVEWQKKEEGIENKILMKYKIEENLDLKKELELCRTLK